MSGTGTVIFTQDIVDRLVDLRQAELVLDDAKKQKIDQKLVRELSDALHIAISQSTDCKPESLGVVHIGTNDGGNYGVIGDRRVYDHTTYPSP